MTVQGAIGAPFWDALAEGELRLPRCRRCGSFHFFPRRWCPTCRSEDMEWVPASGHGTVFARTDVHVAFQDLVGEQLPISVALVDLDEGVRIPARLDRPDAPIEIGERVSLRFADDPRATLPRFVRTEDAR